MGRYVRAVAEESLVWLNVSFVLTAGGCLLQRRFESVGTDRIVSDRRCLNPHLAFFLAAAKSTSSNYEDIRTARCGARQHPVGNG